MILHLPKTSNYSDQSVNPARLGRAGLTELLQMMTTAHNVIGSIKMYNYIYLCYLGGGATPPPPPLMSIIKFGGNTPFKWYHIYQKTSNSSYQSVNPAQPRLAMSATEPRYFGAVPHLNGTTLNRTSKSNQIC